MGAKTGISWTDSTWNPTRGCSRVSSGCDACYAMREAHRHDHPGGAYEGLTRIGPRGVDWNGVIRLVPEMLDQPLRWQTPRRIFVDSMSDMFHENLGWERDIDPVFQTMAAAARHTFQILTKRPENMRNYVSDWQRRTQSASLPNVWLGASVEDQATADERIPWLLATPAAVRFISYEPALGPVDFASWLPRRDGTDCGLYPDLDWVIVGGESGPGARPFNIEWARTTIEQCRAAGVACFVKQVGSKRGPCPECEHPDEVHGFGRTVGCQWSGSVEDGMLSICGCRKQRGEIEHRLGDPMALHAPLDRKGGDMEEWPEDLRVREFPR